MLLNSSLFILHSSLFKEESYEQEVDGDADAERRNHRHLLHQSQSDEKVQEECLHTVVDDMRESESCSSLGVGFHLEGVAGAGDEVEDETENVCQGVGDGRQGVVATFQRWDKCCQDRHGGKIDDVLQDGGDATHYRKTDDLAKFLTLGEVYLVIFFLDTHIYIIMCNESWTIHAWTSMCDKIIRR